MANWAGLTELLRELEAGQALLTDAMVRVRRWAILDVLPVGGGSGYFAWRIAQLLNYTAQQKRTIWNDLKWLESAGRLIRAQDGYRLPQASKANQRESGSVQ